MHRRCASVAHFWCTDDASTSYFLELVCFWNLLINVNYLSRENDNYFCRLLASFKNLTLANCRRRPPLVDAA